MWKKLWIAVTEFAYDLNLFVRVETESEYEELWYLLTLLSD